MRNWLAIVMMTLCAQTAFSGNVDIANGDVAGLISAINNANTNGQDDVINLAPGGTYTFATSADSTNGPNALPPITSDTGHALTINGNGATLDGSSGMRLLQIAAQGKLTVNKLKVINGRQSGATNTAASVQGGGILNYGTLVLNNSSVSNCTLDGAGSSSVVALGGAGIANNGMCSLNASTVNGNRSLQFTPASNPVFMQGGGLYNTGTLNLVNSTVVSNTATGSDASGFNFPAGEGEGGGIFNSGTASAVSCTIALNTAAGGNDGNGNTLVVNDNWQQASNASEISGSGVAPSDPRESAILTTIAPSNSGYTAVLRGVNSTTGIGLVELYALQ